MQLKKNIQKDLQNIKLTNEDMTLKRNWDTQPKIFYVNQKARKTLKKTLKIM